MKSGGRWISPEISWTLSGANRIGKAYQGFCGGSEERGSGWGRVQEAKANLTNPAVRGTGRRGRFGALRAGLPVRLGRGQETRALMDLAQGPGPLAPKARTRMLRRRLES